LAEKGWNKLYGIRYRKNGVKIEELSSNNILTKEAMWEIELDNN